MNKYIGSHLSISTKYKNPFIHMAKYILKYGGNLIELMIDPYNKSLLSPQILDNFRIYSKKHNIATIVHASYTHNIAKTFDKYSVNIDILEKEIHFAHNIGAFCVVLHFGKQLHISLNSAYNNMIKTLLYIHHKTIKYKHILILLETPAGQGSELCYKLDDLALFFNKFVLSINDLDFVNRIKICVDTCHIFASGYDMRTKKSIINYFNKFNSLIGLEYIKLIHLNDSKYDLGQRKDRHANIGKGYIGFRGLKYIFDFFYNNNIPILLETPHNGFTYEIKMLLL